MTLLFLFRWHRISRFHFGGGISCFLPSLPICLMRSILREKKKFYFGTFVQGTALSLAVKGCLFTSRRIRKQSHVSVQLSFLFLHSVEFQDPNSWDDVTHVQGSLTFSFPSYLETPSQSNWQLKVVITEQAYILKLLSPTGCESCISHHKYFFQK